MTPLDKAEAAFQEAAQADTAQAWRSAATLLFKIRRKPRTSGGKSKGRNPGPVAVATFADGQEIRLSFWSQRGKPLDWDRAARVCISGYRLSHGKPDERNYGDSGYDESDRRIRERLPLSAVPSIVRIHETTTGETYIPGTVPGQDRRKAA